MGHSLFPKDGEIFSINALILSHEVFSRMRMSRQTSGWGRDRLDSLGVAELNEKLVTATHTERRFVIMYKLLPNHSRFLMKYRRVFMII